MKVFLASLFTLGLLFLLFLGFILSLLFLSGVIDVFLLLLLSGLLFFFYWLLSPYLNDIVLLFFHRMRWLSLEEFKKMDPELAEFVVDVCRKNNIKVPKIGFIEDDNPTAFCYGSGAFNARMIFTRGLFTYLDEDERQAVLAHEIGHIVHRDFIIMTLAAFLLTLFYNISRALMRTSGRERKRGSAFLLGVVAYIIYLISNYVVLFLSRLREYYADEFSAKHTSTDSLARALIKVAYGILARPDTQREARLMNATRPLGLVDPKGIKTIGAAYASGYSLQNPELLLKTFLFDLHNPWAFFTELHSTHPLIAKRIKRLNGMEKLKFVDFDLVEKFEVDKKKLYAGFFKDVFINYLPYFLFPIIVLLFFFMTFKTVVEQPLTVLLVPLLIPVFIFIFLFIFGISLIIKGFYRYPKKELKKATTLELLGDVYASPVKGKYVQLRGKIVGRGVPGLIVSEDMMFQDVTGLIYLNYEGLLPAFSNLIFSLYKLEQLIGKEVEIKGWYLRGTAPRIELEEIFVLDENRVIKSYVRFWAIGIGMIFLGLLFLPLIFLL